MNAHLYPIRGQLIQAAMLIAIGLVFSGTARSESSGISCTPVQFGAVADGKTLCTQAFQTAIDAVHRAGGGTVVVGPGRFVIGTLELKSHVTLHLEAGSTLLGSTHIADYRRGLWPALIKARGQVAIAVTGTGTIDGQGREVAQDTVRIADSGELLEFFPGVASGASIRTGRASGRDAEIDPYAMQKRGMLREFLMPLEPTATWRVDECVRPVLLEFEDCRDITISGITLQHAANWVQAYRDCEDVRIEGVKVDSSTYWNNDGLDIVNCARVTITGCDINSADDGICLKSDFSITGRCCQDVLISRCRIRSSASAVKLGTASHQGFQRIRIGDLDIRDTYRSAIAIESVDGGAIEDIEVARVIVRHTGNAFFLRIGQRGGAPPAVLRNIVLSDFDVEVPAGKPDEGYEHAGPPPRNVTNLMPASIVGLPDRPIENVMLRNITITYGGGGRRDRAEIPLTKLAAVPEERAAYPEFSIFGELPAWGLYLRHATGIRLENVSLRFEAPDFRSALVADDVSGLVLDRTKILSAGEEPVIVLSAVTDENLDGVEWPAGARERLRRLDPIAPPH